MGDKIKMDLREMGWEGVSAFIWLKMGAVIGSCEYNNIP
jgi:hypothetical protein